MRAGLELTPEHHWAIQWNRNPNRKQNKITKLILVPPLSLKAAEMGRMAGEGPWWLWPYLVTMSHRTPTHIRSSGVLWVEGMEAPSWRMEDRPLLGWPAAEQSKSSASLCPFSPSWNWEDSLLHRKLSWSVALEGLGHPLWWEKISLKETFVLLSPQALVQRSWSVKMEDRARLGVTFISHCLPKYTCHDVNQPFPVHAPTCSLFPIMHSSEFFLFCLVLFCFQLLGHI